MSTQESRLQQIQNWKKSMELKKILENQGIDYQQQDYLAQLTYKIAEKAFGKLGKQNIETKVCEMVEQQTCAICFELMVPPQLSPILLFPCGHTFCRKCTLENGKLKIQKCCLCRAKITNHAVNLSLQNLICAFSEQKQFQQQSTVNAPPGPPPNPESPFQTQYLMFKMRCDILHQERAQLQQQLTVQNQELDRLTVEVNCIQEQMSAIKHQQAQLDKELGCLNGMLSMAVEQSQRITQESVAIAEKIKILDETLKPLQSEMNKYQVLAQK